MKGAYGLFTTPQAAQHAFDGLRSAGIVAREITVMSSEPLEEWEFGSQDRSTVMPWIAVLGAGIGFTTAYLLTSITQQAWPINTGGMPIVTNWTNIIILFELTLLGTVLATVLTLLKTARLPGRVPEYYDPAVSEGKILVGASAPAGVRPDQIERALRAAGAESVKLV
jgi:hypothetical protein